METLTGGGLQVMVVSGHVISYLLPLLHGWYHVQFVPHAILQNTQGTMNATVTTGNQLLISTHRCLPFNNHFLFYSVFIHILDRNMLTPSIVLWPLSIGWDVFILVLWLCKFHSINFRWAMHGQHLPDNFSHFLPFGLLHTHLECQCKTNCPLRVPILLRSMTIMDRMGWLLVTSCIWWLTSRK